MLIVVDFKVANLSQHTIFRLNGENLFLFSHLSYYFKSELGALNKASKATSCSLLSQIRMELERHTYRIY